MPPIRLSDAELDAVFAAARPLTVDRRDGFLQEVADALATCSEIGPGTVHRICAVTQRKFFDPPDLGIPGKGSSIAEVATLGANASRPR